jgi:hypothetical protein
VNNRPVVILILVVVIISHFKCQQRENNKNLNTSLETEKSNSFYDSIIFSTAREKYVYLGKRLLPPRNAPDSVVTDYLLSSRITCVEEVDDTIFVFLNSNLLNSHKNKDLILLNDSLLYNFYPEFYSITIDDDLPYFVYLKNDKDIITFAKDKRTNGFYIENATVKDTVLKLMTGIGIGVDKNVVFKHLGLQDFSYEQKNFTIILCHAAVPSRIWYKSIIKKFVTSDKPNINVLMRVRNNKVESIFLDYWIGYGDKSGRTYH